MKVGELVGRLFESRRMTGTQAEWEGGTEEGRHFRTGSGKVRLSMQMCTGGTEAAPSFFPNSSCGARD
jgi:hypothetical protein